MSSSQGVCAVTERYSPICNTALACAALWLTPVCSTKHSLWSGRRQPKLQQHTPALSLSLSLPLPLSPCLSLPPSLSLSVSLSLPLVGTGDATSGRPCCSHLLCPVTGPCVCAPFPPAASPNFFPNCAACIVSSAVHLPRLQDIQRFLTSHLEALCALPCPPALLHATADPASALSHAPVPSGGVPIPDTIPLLPLPVPYLLSSPSPPTLSPSVSDPPCNF